MDTQEAKYPNPLEAQEHVEMDEFLKEVDWQSVDIDANWLDQTEQYIRPKYTLSYNGVPFAPLGGIHGLTGQPGHGKTFTFTQLMVAIMKGEFYGLKYELSREIPEPKVLYIDTEMEKGNTQLVMLRVYDMMGWQKYTQQEQFKILWLREVTKAADRWAMVLKAIYEMKPTVVFLDGLIDVIGDFNDNKECQTLIYQVMGTASHYGISIWCLLHENPGSEKMVGHAGSFLERKATDVLKTKKDKGTEVIFSVEQKKARSRDLDKWQFVIDDDDNHYGHPRLLTTQEVNEATQEELEADRIAKQNAYREELRKDLTIMDTESWSKTRLRDYLREKYKIGTDKAQKRIDDAVAFGLLTVSGTIDKTKYTSTAANLLNENLEDYTL